MKTKAIVTAPERTPLDLFFDCLASSERRRLLGYLQDRVPASASRDELATTLAAEKYDTSPDHPTDEQREQALATLRHAHLPKLEAAGLITQETDENAVSLSDHPGYRDPTIREIISGEVSEGSDSLDVLFRALSDSRRRAVLDVLSYRYRPVQVRSVARDVAAIEREVPSREVSTEDLDRVLLSLQYVQLPHLQQAELIEYDTDEGTVSYEGHPILRVSWTRWELGPDLNVTSTDSSIDAGV